VCTKLRKALELRQSRNGTPPGLGELGFKELMLLPYDFSHEAIHHKTTRALMEKMTFSHGGPEYDRRYPDGIPTSIAITDDQGLRRDSGLVMYPSGHARNTTADLKGILNHKWTSLAELAVAPDDSPAAKALTRRYSNIAKKSVAEIAAINDFTLHVRGAFE
jgi:2-methylcitrate dehydratase